VKQLTHTFFQQQAYPVNGTKDDKFLPDDVARHYPWDAHNLDKFKLESKTTDPRYKAISILDLMSENTRFLTKVRYLSKGKAPGKDDIPNEVLKNLPDHLLEAIHSLFILMSGTTPADWKISHTVLLYKKNCPLDLKNYRPIALADTLAKLWTGMLAECISDMLKALTFSAAAKRGSAASITPSDRFRWSNKSSRTLN